LKAKLIAFLLDAIPLVPLKTTKFPFSQLQNERDRVPLGLSLAWDLRNLKIPFQKTKKAENFPFSP